MDNFNLIVKKVVGVEESIGYEFRDGKFVEGHVFDRREAEPTISYLIYDIHDETYRALTPFEDTLVRHVLKVGVPTPKPETKTKSSKELDF